MATKPTGQQLENLTNALLNGFDHNSLQQLTIHKLDLPLEWVTPVAGKRDLTTIVGVLVAHFAAQKCGLKRLLVGAQKENPTNAALKELMVKWFDIEFEPIDLSEIKERLADSVIGIDMNDVEAASIELDSITAQGDGDVTGVKISGVKASGNIKISNVRADSHLGQSAAK